MEQLTTDRRTATVPAFTNATGALLQSIPQFVWRNAEESPNAVAFRTIHDGDWRGRTWRERTWSNVQQQVAEIGAGLLGLMSDDKDADLRFGYVIGPNSPEFFIAEYALQAVGTAAFPLFEQMTALEMQDTLATYPADVAFSGSSAATRRLLDAAGVLGIEYVIQWGPDAVTDDPRVVALASLQDRGRRALSADPSIVDRRVESGTFDDIACVILTSGTTGVSKGVLGSHRYMLDLAARYAHVYRASAFDRYLSYLPPAFSVEQYNGMTLAAALPLDVAFASSPATVADDFVSSRASLKFLGPRQWEELRATLPDDLLSDLEQVRAQKKSIREQLGLQHVKSGISAGGSLSGTVFEFFNAIDLEIRNVYGFAEVGIISATEGCDPSESVGGALPTAYGSEPIQIRVDADGEIHCTGGVMCSGYWGSQNRLSYADDGWLRSGDAGEMDNGVLRVLDRIGNIQRLPDGTSFAPQPIEISAMGSPYISNLVLIGGREDDSRVGALIQVNDLAIRRGVFPADDGPSDYESLVRSSAVIDVLMTEMRKINANRPASQHISLIGILPKPLSTEDGELTRSMKLRRSEVVRRYDSLIASMYDNSADVVQFEVYVGRTGEGHTRPFTTRVAHL
jgi:long-chain acyl-CoA synthetase